MKKLILALLATLALAPAAHAVGAGCQATSGTNFPLEKIRDNATGTQIWGCINRSFEAIASSMPVIGSTSSYTPLGWLAVNRISGRSSGSSGIWISSATTFTSSMTITAPEGLRIVYHADLGSATVRAGLTVVGTTTLQGVLSSSGAGYFSGSVTASSGTFTTAVVGGGAGGTVTSEVRITGAGGPPPASGSSGGNTRFRIGAVDGNVLDFGNYASAPYGVWLQGNDRGNFSTTYPMILQPNGGSVGIGTASPGATLDVAGNGAFASGVTASSVTINSGDLLLKNNRNINWVDAGGTTRNAIWWDGSDLLNFQSGSHMTFNPGFAEYMRLTSAGKLGIGTASPGTKLHVSSGIYTLDGTTARMNLYAPFNSGWYGYGNANSNKQFAGLYNDADGDGILDLNNLNEVLQVRLHANGDSFFNGGALGIGTNAPVAGYDLTVNNNAANAIRVTADAGYELNFAGAAAANIYHSESGQVIYIGTNGGDLNLGNSDGGTNLVVDGPTGNIGIKTASPASTSTLHVAGTASIMGAFTAGTSSGTRIDDHGHTYFRGAAPTVTSCGTSPSITGTDAAGKVTTGSPGSTTCTINFGSAWDTAPHCVPTSNAVAGISGQAVGVQSVSTTQLVLAFETTFGSVDVRWVCFGTE